MTVSIQSVTKTFGQVVALREVSLDIADGELVFLLGPSGCGKTTLLRCLAGFEDVTSGRIDMDGQNIAGRPPHLRNTAMVFQGYALWPHMTVAQNVGFGLEVKGVPRDERERRVRRALETVRITDLAQRRPNEISGGQQQRVALARTLVVEPGCLLLDEPLANLDAKLRRDMRAEIRRICKENRLTAVYVTHDRQEALSMADRIAVLRDGILLQAGTPREVYARPVNGFVAGFIGETNFIAAKLVDRTGSGVRLDTVFGQLVSTVPCDSLPVGARVRLSIRPESLHLDGGDENCFTAQLAETTYLGEISEHLVKVHDGLALKVFELNPRRDLKPGMALRLAVDPGDIVVLPEDQE